MCDGEQEPGQRGARTWVTGSKDLENREQGHVQRGARTWVTGIEDMGDGEQGHG